MRAVETTRSSCERKVTVLDQVLSAKDIRFLRSPHPYLTNLSITFNVVDSLVITRSFSPECVPPRSQAAAPAVPNEQRTVTLLQ